MRLGLLLGDDETRSSLRRRQGSVFTWAMTRLALLEDDGVMSLGLPLGGDETLFLGEDETLFSYTTMRFSSLG